MKKKLYYHKTDGGAEYLTDTYITWKHDGKSGREGTINEDTKLCIRIDGDITKDVEVVTDNSLDLLDALKAILSHAESGTLAVHETGKPTVYTMDEIAKIARATIQKAESV